ncbi:hypothetical protein P4O66_001990 [Electrophorus voltai]|uniref:Uncharacterized protein n=1 Tax=Electrophorus voltai TaxID=2609070 RepID=A0AAD9E616_9TELE|nr:hypothetical protein P4O66_001990 [Electrophorus voltai]
MRPSLCDLLLEVRCSPTKPCGKGSKRKQDDMDDDDEEEEQLSWVEVLTTQNLADEDHSADPDYEASRNLGPVSEVETDSEEYQSHNETESDLEVEKGVVVIKDLETVRVPLPPQTICTQYKSQGNSFAGIVMAEWRVNGAVARTLPSTQREPAAGNEGCEREPGHARFPPDTPVLTQSAPLYPESQAGADSPREAPCPMPTGVGGRNCKPSRKTHVPPTTTARTQERDRRPAGHVRAETLLGLC